MTPMEAWGIIRANLENLYKMRRDDKFKGYTDAETEAEVICFQALKLMEEKLKGSKSTRLEVGVNK